MVLIATLAGTALHAQDQWSLSIIYPNDGRTFTAPANVVLEATNIGFEGLIDGTNPPPSEVVQFFANSNLVGTATNVLGTNVPNVIWMSVPAGTYTLVAVGNIGTNTATSQPVTVTVNEESSNPQTNHPPDSVFGIGILYPAPGMVFTTPASVVIEVGNSGLEGLTGDTNLPPSELIQFFANSNLVATITNTLGTDVSDATWGNVPPGTYTLVAVGSVGTNVATSQPVTITVNEATSNPDTNSGSSFTISIESPTNSEVYTAPASIQLEGVVNGIWKSLTSFEVVQFFANSNLIATVTNLVGTNVSFATWANIAAGNYMMTAVVSNNDGDVATSLPVSISVAENTNPPAVTTFGTIVSPTNGSVYAAPADIGLEETWSAGNPTASATVQFYANSNLIATVNSGPGTNTCFAAWTNVAAGSYNLTVVLTYGSATGSSAPVSITVSDGSTNGPLPSVAARSQLPVVGVFPGNTTIGAPTSHVAGGCVYLSIGATSGMAYSLESSADLIHWAPVFTNKAVNGEAQYVAPNGYNASQFYRIVPANPSSN